MITAEGIHKNFGEKKVLEGVSATFNAGECSLIIGKSGAGKTVFLKCLVGLETPDEGEVLFDGRDITRMDDEQETKIRQEMGMLFQGSALFDSMSLFDNVLFPIMMFSKLKRRERHARVKECLSRVQLWDARYKYPDEISGGMKKRGAIARAIAMNPKYLFCDEPTSGLDPATSKVIDGLLKEITRENNITTIVNTHDMNSVKNIGDKVIFLNEGKIDWEGKGSEIEKSDNQLLKNFVFISKL